MSAAVNPKESVYDLQREENISTQTTQCAQRMRKVKAFIKDYWKTIAVIGFTIGAASSSILDCYDSDYHWGACPVSLSIGDNYVMIDGTGLAIATSVGLSSYYARKALKVIQKKTEGKIQKLAKAYLYITHKYQFDLLMTIPYITFTTASGDACITSTFCYVKNPAVSLALIGFTFGTYKDLVDDNTEDPNRPICTDINVIRGLTT